MNAVRRKREPQGWAPFGAGFLFFLQGGWRRWLALLALIGLFVGSVVYAWQQWGGQITQSEEYFVSADNIDVTAPPKWIRTDVKADVVRDGGLARLSLLDRQLTIRIAHAFAAHQWVDKVVRVSKHHPARIVVELVYRKPVAMVEVVSNGQPGLLPVDANGILLPPADFSSDQAHEFLRIAATDTTPAGPVGTPWGDPRVHGAARIAAAFQDAWKPLGLHRIQANRPQTADKQVQGVDDATYDLLTRKGSRIIWGPAPAADNPTDAVAALKKVQRLVAQVQSRGGLDTEKGPTQIDLNSSPFGPRTAQKPSRR